MGSFSKNIKRSNCVAFSKSRDVPLQWIWLRWSKQIDRAIIPSSNSGFIVCAKAKDTESYRLYCVILTVILYTWFEAIVFDDERLILV